METTQNERCLRQFCIMWVFHTLFHLCSGYSPSLKKCDTKAKSQQEATARQWPCLGTWWGAGEKGGNGFLSWLSPPCITEICTPCWWRQRWHLERNQPGRSSSLLNLPPLPLLIHEDTATFPSAGTAETCHLPQGCISP